MARLLGCLLFVFANFEHGAPPGSSTRRIFHGQAYTETSESSWDYLTTMAEVAEVAGTRIDRVQ